MPEWSKKLEPGGSGVETRTELLVLNGGDMVRATESGPILVNEILEENM